MKDFSQDIARWGDMVVNADLIDGELYTRYEVKRGLRDAAGKGVLAGLTRIGEVHSYIIDEGETVPQPGRLIYRGMDIENLVEGFRNSNRPGYEETVYLLLMGELPNEEELKKFNEVISEYRNLPEGFVRDMIMGLPSKDMMNVLARSVLAFYSFDDNPDDTSIENVLKQSLRLIAVMPQLAVYGYNAYKYYHGESSLVIHTPKAELGIAENILHMLRDNNAYTKLEADLLDMSLVLHAEHGGGNNSSFTTHVVTSSGTDTYSTIAAAIGSLKGPRHGGANIKVGEMLDDLKVTVKDWENEDEISQYVEDLMDKKAFDKQGLVYGIGHAVYTISDPRAEIFKDYVRKLADANGFMDEFQLFDRFERLAPKIIAKRKNMDRPISSNVDFYSGFVYRMLGIPRELYTPLFAISRTVGWCAHRIEELANGSKIIRPAYKSVAKRRSYVPMEER